MSKKKRRNQESSPKTISLGLSDSGNNKMPENDAAQANASNLPNWISYLKANWWAVGLTLFLALGAFGAGLKYLEDSANRERTVAGKAQNNQQSFLSKINPFASNPDPTPTPQLSKEYIYAGSGGRLLTVEDANASAAPPADLAIWRPSNGEWWVMAGTGTQQVTQQWGSSGDVTVPGDYDGDGKTDFALFRPSNSNWYLIYSSTGSSIQFSFGTTGDKAVPADYDGDGKTDIAVFRNSNTTWYISQSSTSSTVYGTYGSSGDIPAPADYDGDGKADLAVFRDSTGHFYSLNSSNSQTLDTTFGTSGDEPVCADYDGDGKADVALWRSSNATWYIKQSSDGNTSTVQLGIGTDTPVQNDYDGDGKVDIAVWRGTASTSPGGDVGRWFIRNSSNPSNLRYETWGIAGDKPVPAFWKR
jgi:hypothetical protein